MRPPPASAVADTCLSGAVITGAGLGGFVDGIVLHQVLQWHHVLSDHGSFPTTTIAGLEGNTVADGLFHAASWLAVVAGLVLVFRALTGGAGAGRSWPTLVGGLLMGWGLFNLVEGVVDHHLLSIHHVRDDVADPLPWDLAFLAVGALLLLGGWALSRRTSTAEPDYPSPNR